MKINQFALLIGVLSALFVFLGMPDEESVNFEIKKQSFNAYDKMYESFKKDSEKLSALKDESVKAFLQKSPSEFESEVSQRSASALDSPFRSA